MKYFFHNYEKIKINNQANNEKSYYPNKIFTLSFLKFILLIFLFLNLLFCIKIIPRFQKIKRTKEKRNLKKFIDFDKYEVSIIINMKNLNKKKHLLFYKIMRKFNSTRNFYFIKTDGSSLNENLSQLVENSSVKIVQSNFPDSIFLPLVVSLFGNTTPELVLFIEGEDIMDKSENKLIKWIANAYQNIIDNGYDYIFGNYQIIDGKKIGCSLLFSKASILEHLLYYTNSDTSSANPFIQLSLATKTNFCFIPFNYIKSSRLENIHLRLSVNMNCPSTDDKNIPDFCIMLPSFKRNYFSSSFAAFSKQTYKPKFYIIIQNDNRIHLNLPLIQKMVNQTIYHIWMQNWNSFFFLTFRLSSLFPCDFVLKYDDDQWPIDNTIQKRLISFAKGKNVIIGNRGYLFNKSYCGYSAKNFNKIKKNIVDHAAVPLFIRPGYLKLEARNSIYRLYHGEDVSLSLNSWNLCNVTSIKMKMKIREMQKDGKNRKAEKQIISAIKEEKETNFSPFLKTYCFLIRSGYIPKLWSKFQIPKKDYLNITIKHKSLN